MVKKVSLMVLIFFIGISGFLLGSRWMNSQPEPVITSEVLDQHIKGVSRLTTVEYHYTNMGKFENQNDFYGWKVPLTRKSFIVSYDGKITAGVELENVEITIEEDRIRVYLPQAKILTHEMDEQSLQIFDETNNIFNQIKLTDYNQFHIDQKENMEEKAVANGILAEAQNKAEECIRQIIGAIAGKDEEFTYEIQFITK